MEHFRWLFLSFSGNISDQKIVENLPDFAVQNRNKRSKNVDYTYRLDSVAC